jgi:hypothetical protein
MRILPRLRLLPLAAILTFFTLPGAAWASHEMGALIWWCPGSPASTELPYKFHLEVVYQGTVGVGYQVAETFYFGDGTSAPVVLTATEVHPGSPEGWFIAKAVIEHTYAATAGVVEAGLQTCCRIDGNLGIGLNNRSFGNLTLRVPVDLANRFICTPVITNPKVEWFRGTLGDTFTFPIQPVDHNPYTFRIATDAEAGGGPNAGGLALEPGTGILDWTPTAGDPSRLWTTQVRVAQTGVGESGLDFLLGLDSDRPVCQLARIEPGPPTRLHVLVQDPRSGLGNIRVVQAVNATVAVPGFGSGDSTPYTVVATKIDQGASSRLDLQVSDTVGNVTDCDPLLTEVIRSAGPPESHTYGGISPEEHLVSVFNGDPGLRNLRIDVNGRKFEMAGLKPGETRALDVGRAVRAGESSTVTLTSLGQPGGRAVVMISGSGEP